MDLTALPLNLPGAETFATWVKIHDRVRAGEMPPEKKPRPAPKELDRAMSALAKELSHIDTARQKRDGRSQLRRLNRVEFENTLRDLLAVPGLKVRESLPADGLSHGFDRLAGALDISYVHVEKYLAAVDTALKTALCPVPEKPPVFKYRYQPWVPTRHGGRESDLWVWEHMENVIGLVGMEQDPTFKRIDGFKIQDDEPKATALGLFRHEDCAYRAPLAFVPAFSGPHKLRVSGYSFGWDGKKVVPTERHGAFSWGIYSTGEQFGTVGVPPNHAGEAEISAWLERGGGVTGDQDLVKITGASLEDIRYLPPYAAQGIAMEWVEIEGPFFEQWPPPSHHALFDNLPVKEWTKKSGVPKPVQHEWAVKFGDTFPTDIYGEKGEKRQVAYVASEDSAKDAERLLRRFLRRALRRPPTEAEVTRYTAQAKARLDGGAAFQDAMVATYRVVLASPAFLFLNESPGKLDDFALAARLSYFLWSSTPDAELSVLADQGKLHQPAVLRAQTERLLNDPRAARFTDNFLGQWLGLHDIAATQPDGKLYPEFKPWLQEAMLLEAHAYFNELLRGDLSVTRIVKSDFAMLNEPLAHLYGIEGVRGWKLRRIALPPESKRGGFLTMGGVLKTTANGTTTSPVKRGAFVMERILGIVPTPPPADAGSIEPDTRGATTIREQLAQHKRNASCATCHQKMDGYGFALESFDVTGERRENYRAFVGDAEDRSRKIVNGSHVKYIPGPPVDCTGTMPDGHPFADVDGLRDLLAANPAALARAFTSHLLTYATGAEISFADRAVVEAITQGTKSNNYGLRSLLHAVVQSDLFRSK